MGVVFVEESGEWTRFWWLTVESALHFHLPSKWEGLWCGRGGGVQLWIIRVRPG